ncbi:hypothetical protein [Yinghuangia seranimata]|uniref:hypothetical protein n=1 Tax=Yinghuangia seranimata TaxID=408067 RepID=UPI00248BB385|nr:hypothetical protein [Yinghuangia seranimata]MDI2128438.1 hypothetical protein [Yinghuangia seranimata]
MPRRIRRALLGAALSAAATASLLAGSAGTAHAAPTVYAVHLSWLTIEATQDNNSYDEAYIKVNGATVWGPHDVPENSPQNIGVSLPTFYYDSDHTLTVEAWDRDPGRDDRIGYFRLGANPALGGQAIQLRGNDGVYDIFFYVERAN